MGGLPSLSRHTLVRTADTHAIVAFRGGGAESNSAFLGAKAMLLYWLGSQAPNGSASRHAGQKGVKPREWQPAILASCREL